MRVLALDIGKVRTGIATSDPQGRVASPVCVLPTDDILVGAPAWKRVLQDWEPGMLLAGLPYSLSGDASVQTKKAREVAERIAQACALPIAFTDERLSSAEAKRILHEEGVRAKEMRGKVDMIAASVFLQTWLDEQLSGAPGTAGASHTEAGEPA